MKLAKLTCAHAPVPMVERKHSQDLCPAQAGVGEWAPVPSWPTDGRTHSPVCRVGGEGRTNRSQCPSPCPHVTYPPDRVPAAGLGVSTVWGLAGGQERFPEAPTGFPSPGPREKRSPARKPLRRCPHYITDIPATRPATLRRGASGNPSRASAFRPGRRAGRAAPSPRSGRWAAYSPRPCAQGQRPQEGARAGRRRGRG